MQFYAEGRQGNQGTAGTFDAGIESALVAMLSSVKFLARVEPPPAGAKPGSIYRLSGLETGVAAFVLLVEQHSRRRAAHRGRGRKAAGPRSIGARDPAHAGRPALQDLDH